MELVPPLIRKTLLEDADFREEYGFKTDAVLSFGDSGVSIQRSDFFDAIRKVLSGASEMEVTDNGWPEMEARKHQRERRTAEPCTFSWQAASHPT